MDTLQTYVDFIFSVLHIKLLTSHPRMEAQALLKTLNHGGNYIDHIT